MLLFKQDLSGILHLVLLLSVVVLQEMGGVGITLLGLCGALSLDFQKLTKQELDRVLALPADHFRKRNVLKAQAGIAMLPTGTD